jgi:tetratricopeptide (TPR) repeat protein
MAFFPLMVAAQGELEIFSNLGTSLAPLTRLDSVLKQNGAIDSSGNFNRDKFEAESWYQFMAFLTSTINSMGSTSADSAGLYITLGKINSLKGNYEGYLKAAKVTMLGAIATGLIIDNYKQYSFARNLYVSLMFKMAGMKYDAFDVIKNDINNTVKEFVGALKIPEDNPTGQKILTWTKNIKDNKFVKTAASGFDLGFSVVGLALDGIALCNDEDLKIGNVTYSNIKSQVGLAMGVLSLGSTLTGLATTAVPVLGFAVWGGTVVLDQIGQRRKKWLENYKDSYDFLMLYDDNFKEFSEGKMGVLAKTSSLILLEEKFGHLNGAEGEAGELYEAMHRKAVLSSYYDLDQFDLPKQNISELKDLWRLKATKDPLFVSEELKKVDVFPVYFCPDFYIQKKLRGFITGLSDSERAENKGLLDTVTLRIEQMPYNYLPLADIVENEWSIELLREAFYADCVQVAAREIDAVKSMVSIISKEFGGALNYETLQLDTLMTDIEVFNNRGSVSGLSRRLDALEKALKLQKKYDEKLADLGNKEEALEEFKREFGLEANIAYGVLSPTGGGGRAFEGRPLSEAINLFGGSIMQEADYLLNEVPKRNADQIVNTIINLYAAKRHLDFIEILKQFCEERKSFLNSEASFVNEKIKAYIETGECLDIENSWKDFLAEIKSPKKSFEDSITLIKDSSEKMQEAIKTFKDMIEKQHDISYTDSFTLGTSCLNHLKELQRICKRLTSQMQEFCEEHNIDLKLKFAESDERSEYFDIDKFEFKGTLEAMDASSQLDFPEINEIAEAVKPAVYNESEDPGYLTGDNHSGRFNEKPPIQSEDPGYMTGDNHHTNGSSSDTPKPDKPFTKPNRPQIE